LPRRSSRPEFQAGDGLKARNGPGADAKDQKNVLTPEVATQNGANWLVIGSEINGAENPAAAAEALNIRIAQALAEKEKTEQQKGAVAK
jgi:orotidine-5'-phosphate decarboxylase